ncbi:MAG: hypothetical protein ACRDZ4_00330 [Egibacteraceae bacterium]
MSQVVDRAVRELPFLTRAQVVEEERHEPRFWNYFSMLALSENPGRAVDDDMKKAVVNELAPGSYPESRGRWPMLRAKVNTVRRRIATHLYGGGPLADLVGMGQSIPGLYTSIEQGPPAQPVPGAITSLDQSASGGDIWSSIASVIGTVGTAAANIYATQIKADAAKSVARLQAEAAAQAIASTQAAAGAVPLSPQATATPGAATATSTIILYVVLGLLGLGGIFFLVNMLSKKR